MVLSLMTLKGVLLVESRVYSISIEIINTQTFYDVIGLLVLKRVVVVERKVYSISIAILFWIVLTNTDIYDGIGLFVLEEVVMVEGGSTPYSSPYVHTYIYTCIHTYMLPQTYMISVILVFVFLKFPSSNISWFAEICKFQKYGNLEILNHVCMYVWRQMWLSPCMSVSGMDEYNEF